MEHLQRLAPLLGTDNIIHVQGLQGNGRLTGLREGTRRDHPSGSAFVRFPADKADREYHASRVYAGPDLTPDPMPEG